ncbi:hypothetical protein PCE1_000877 [Barthelona sp. PCE]
MKRILFFIVAVFLLGLVSANNDFVFTDWFEQKLDHFDYTNDATWKQRYHINQKYWEGEGPLIFYIGGEGPCTSRSVESGFVVEIAEELKGLVIALEHRFYGESQPFRHMTTENLKFLNSKQGLTDLAQFVSHIKKQIAINGYTPKVMVVGGSYPGAMASWFCSWYESSGLVDFCYSSSGVINAIEKFTTFDDLIISVTGEQCSTALRRISRLIDTKLEAKATNRAIKKRLLAEKLIDADIYYLVADAMIMGPQYSQKSALCNPINDAMSKHATDEELLTVFIRYLTETFYPNILHSTSAEYDRKYLLKTDTSKYATASRAWYWQKCTDLAYFQVYSEGDFRSPHLTVDWHLDKCKSVFGIETRPRVEETNAIFGGANPKHQRNTLYVNARDDPWQEASIDRSKVAGNAKISSIFITGDESGMYGHCIDLHASKSDDTEVLKQARRDILAKVKYYLGM